MTDAGLPTSYFVELVDAEEHPTVSCSHREHFGKDDVQASFHIELLANEHFTTFACDEHLIAMLRPPARGDDEEARWKLPRLK